MAERRGRRDQRNYYNDPRQNRGDYYEDPRQGRSDYYGEPRQDYYEEPRQQDYYEDPQRGEQDYYEDPRQNTRGYYNDPRYYGNSEQGYQRQQRYYGAPQMNYEDPYYSGGGRKKKKKKHRKLLFVIELIIVLILAMGIFAFVQLGRVNRQKLGEILINSGLGTGSGYQNIALFGVDSREGNMESGTNSDTIMVASINKKNGDVKLVSVYRDTYLDNTNGTYTKANAAFAGGGAERAVNMLNKNLDLDIKDFVTIDFNGVIEAVDLLGGIELDITEEERGWLNGYLVETSQVTGVAAENVEYSGNNIHVNGIQAMAYCRIRYTEGWDYKRTERQRIVLEKVFQKAQQKGVTGLIPLVSSMMDYISTSFGNTELIALASKVASYHIVDTQGFPFEKEAIDFFAGDCVVPVNLAQNVKELHAYLFGDNNYVPSNTVQEISNKIISDSGVQ